ncbi:MAG: hypothetical protein M1820_000413 [Bogoriella megaspora]|nr:MAG: hypothetical protein M1820_000413 [Bogoriella megaspora]
MHSFIAATVLLAAVANAVPLDKRAVEWVRVTKDVFTTVPVTTTVWVDPSHAAPSASGAEFHPSAEAHSFSYSRPSQPAATSEPAAPTSTVAPPAPAPPAPSSSSSSSVFVPPVPSTTAVPSTSVAPAPVPSPAPVESSAAAPAPSAASTDSLPSDITIWTPPSRVMGDAPITSGPATSGSKYDGMATYYEAGLGACGWTNTGSDNIVALVEGMFDKYTPTSGLHQGSANYNTVCGKKIIITNTDTGKKYPATITDRCPGCKENSLDFSQSLFEAVIGDTAIGTTGISWEFE